MYIIMLMSLKGHHMRKKKFDRLISEYDIKPLESLAEVGLFKSGPYIIEMKESAEDLILPKLLEQSKVQAHAIIAYTDKPIDRLLFDNILKETEVKFTVASFVLKEEIVIIVVQDSEENYSHVFAIGLAELPSNELKENFDKLASLYQEVISNAAAT